MERDFLIQLTNNLYRLTLFFPKKEPLRYKMRELADDILAQNNGNRISIISRLEILDNFFEVAKAQNWVNISDILAVQTEYINLMEELKKSKLARNEETPANEVRPQLTKGGQALLERQERILAFLKENDRVQVWKVKQAFPEVTKRTLRRDFEQMLRQGLIERIGEKNNTFYQLNVGRA